MLNEEYFTCLAGSPQTWDHELLDLKGESLVDAQERQHAEGRRTVVLSKAGASWCVRFNSSLDGFAVLYKADDRDDAIDWGKTWTFMDPAKREFIARKDLLD